MRKYSTNFKKAVIKEWVYIMGEKKHYDRYVEKWLNHEDSDKIIDSMLEVIMEKGEE